MTNEQSQLDPALSPKYRYDAFISYSHRDKETVEWLYHLLANQWVPGKGSRRKIFRDDDSLAAGVLPDKLKNALAESRFLIVCCSAESAKSTYVNLEIAEFLKSHPAKNVLACLTGATMKEGAFFAPAAISQVESELGGELFKPNLSGNPAKEKGKVLRDYQKQAFALLAPLVDLPDKEAILDRQAKFKWWATVLSMVALVLVISGFYVSRTDWYQIWQVRRAAPTLIAQAKAANVTDWLRALALANYAKDAFALAVEIPDPDDRAQAIRAINEALTEARKLQAKIVLPAQTPQPDEALSSSADPATTIAAIKKLKASAEDFVRASFELTISSQTGEAKKLATSAQELSYKIEKDITYNPALQRALIELAEKTSANNKDVAKLALEALLPGLPEEIFPAETFELLLAEKYDEAWRAVRKTSDLEKKVPASLVIARLWQTKGNTQAAKAALQEAVATAKLIKAPVARIMWLTMVANAFHSLNEKALAIQTANAAVAMLREPDALTSPTITLVPVAELLWRLDQSAPAAHVAEIILEELKKEKSQLFKVSYLPVAAPILVKLGKQDAALAIARKSEALEDRVQSMRAIAFALAENGNKEAAQPLAHEALTWARQIESPKDRASALWEIISVFSKLGLNDQTKQVADEFILAVRKLEDTRDHDEALRAVVQLLSDMGKFDDALVAIAEIRADDSRSKALSELAIKIAGKRRLRLARLTAERSWVSDHRLNAYTAIMLEYAQQQSPALSQISYGRN